MRRWAAAVAVVVLLGSCSADSDEPAVPTEPSAATVPGQSPEASPEASPSTGAAPATATPTTGDSPASRGPAPAPAAPAPTPGGGEPDSDADLGDQPRTADGRPAGPAPLGIIDSCALGPLVVGMNAERAEGTGLVDWLLASDGPSGFIFKPSPDVFIAGTDADGIVGFLVKDQDWQTPQGITAGVSTRGDLEQAYGEQLQPLTTPEGYSYFLVRDGDCGFFFAPDSFGPDDGPIVVIISGLWDAVSRARPNTSFG